MSKVCHRHCPPGGSVLGTALAAAILAVIAYAVARVVAAVAAGVMTAGFVLLAASAAAAIARIRHLNRPAPVRGAQIARAARALRATPVQAALPRSQRAALSARRIVPGTVITEAAESRVGIERS